MQHELYIEKKDVIKWVSRKTLKKNTSEKVNFKYVDLFCGCGGLSLGVEKAALDNNLFPSCVMAVDIKLAPLQVFEKNIIHSSNAVLNSDITKIFRGVNEKLSDEEIFIKKKISKLDVLVAGPPCQGHSNLNNSTRRNDPRNALYLSCIRAIEVFQPKLVIIENVPSVIHSLEGVVQTTEDKLVELGYFVQHLNINFLDLGIPQARKRHILVASTKKNFVESLKTLTSRRQVPTLKDFIFNIDDGQGLLFQSGRLSDENMKRVRYLFDKNVFDLPNQFRPSCHRDNDHSYKSVYGRLNWDLPAQTLTSGYGSMGQGRYIHPSKMRTINSREAIRIQGFPDYYSFDSVSKVTDLREMVANAVPPQLTYKIVDLFINNSQA